MAISKLILNGEVQMDVTSDTVEANKLLEGETATKNDGTKVTGTFVAPDPIISSLSVTPTESAQTFNEASISGYKPVTVGAIASDYVGSAIPMRSDVNLTGLETYSGYKVQAQQGYYSQTASYNISAASINISGPYFTYSLGYFSGAVNITTSGYAKQSSYSFSQQLSTLSSQTITPGSESQYIPANRWLTGSQTIAAIASDYVGSAIPRMSSENMTQQGVYVYASAGYYSTSAIYELPVYTHLDPSITFYPYDGQISAKHDAYDVMMNNGLTHGNAYTTSSYQLPTLSAQTITPGSTTQIISSYQWLTGSLTIAGISLMSKTVDPSESIQVITANNILVDEQNKSGSARASSVSIVIDSLSSLESGKTYHIIGSATAKRYNNPSAEAAITFDTDWIYGTDIPFEASVANLVTSIVINSNYIAFRFSSTDDNAVYYLNLQIYEKGYDGLSQVTVNAIPSSYIIPSGTYSVTENGTYDIGSYASVDVSVAGGDTAIEDAVIGGIPAAVSIYSNDRISLIKYGACQNINASVFDVPNVSNIGPYAFSDNSYVNTVLTSKLLNVSSHAFRNCRNLENIDLSPVLFISEYAFSGTKLSSSLTLSYLVSMSQYAFLGCDSLQLVSLPYYDRPISSYTFHVCDVLSEFYAPFATTIQGSAFNQCRGLQKCNIITAREINAYAFSRCSNLSSIAFGAQSIGLVTIGSCAFSGCQKLHDVYICNRLSGSGTIGAYAFSGCTSLSNLYILSPSYVALSNSNAFRSTPISYSTEGYGSIYVPDTLYDSYISGANWSYFSARFVSLTSSEVDAIFDSLSEVNLWSYREADPPNSISSRQLPDGIYKSLNQLIGKQAEYKLLLKDNPGEQTANYLYSMAIFSQILLQSYTTFTAVRPSLSLNFSLCVDLENNTVLYNFNSGRIYGFSFYLRCL